MTVPRLTLLSTETILLENAQNDLPLMRKE